MLFFTSLWNFQRDVLQAKGQVIVKDQRIAKEIMQAEKEI